MYSRCLALFFPCRKPKIPAQKDLSKQSLLNEEQAQPAFELMMMGINADAKRYLEQRSLLGHPESQTVSVANKKSLEDLASEMRRKYKIVAQKQAALAKLEVGSPEHQVMAETLAQDRLASEQAEKLLLESMKNRAQYLASFDSEDEGAEVRPQMKL
jgi:hypothetical protein